MAQELVEWNKWMDDLMAITYHIEEARDIAFKEPPEGDVPKSMIAKRDMLHDRVTLAISSMLGERL